MVMQSWQDFRPAGKKILTMIIWDFLMRHWPLYGLGITLLIITDLLSILIPRTVGRAIDIIGGNGDVTDSLWLLAAIAAAMAVLRFFYRECIMGTTRRLEYFLRNQIFRHALYLPMSIYDEAGPGKIMALAVNDVTSVRVAVGLGIMLLVDAGIMGAVSFTMMFRSIDPTLTIVSVLPLPLVFIAAAVLGRAVHERFRRVQEKFSALTEFAQELFGGVKVVKAFGVEDILTARFADVNRDNMTANLALAKIQSVYIPITHVAPLACYALALGFGGRLIIENRISVGDLAAFTGYLGLIIWPVMGLGYLINIVQRGKASWVRIRDFLAILPYEDAQQTSETGSRCDLSGEIELRDLTFQYPSASVPSLQGLNLRIPAGSTIGIVGRTGSGKTTLLRLLLRLYPVPDGKILIGGADVNRLDFVGLRSAIGYVPQDAALFSATIAENISFGQPYEREEVLEAARLAVVREDIDARAEGFASRLGEKGTRLSGGQRQRVAVARALIRRPDLLLLDDVFSALDYRTQTELVENLREVEAGRTTLIVSQRIAAVKHARFILVMDGGRIAETGTHDELIAAGGLYYRLYEQQLAAGEVS